MKKCRVIGIIVVLAILMMTFTGCTDESIKVQIENTEDSITVNADKNCSMEFTIEVKSDEEINTITKSFMFKANETKTLTIKDFVSENYNHESKITKISYGMPYNETEDTLIIWMVAFCVIVVLFFTYLIISGISWNRYRQRMLSILSMTDHKDRY